MFNDILLALDEFDSSMARMLKGRPIDGSLPGPRRNETQMRLTRESNRRIEGRSMFVARIRVIGSCQDDHETVSFSLNGECVREVERGNAIMKNGLFWSWWGSH